MTYELDYCILAYYCNAQTTLFLAKIYFTYFEIYSSGAKPGLLSAQPSVSSVQKYDNCDAPQVTVVYPPSPVGFPPPLPQPLDALTRPHSCRRPLYISKATL